LAKVGKINSIKLRISGGYGEVKMCKSLDGTGEERAVKIINKARMSAKQSKMFANEI
jgi:hypothetical protein